MSWRRQDQIEVVSRLVPMLHEKGTANAAYFLFTVMSQLGSAPDVPPGAWRPAISGMLKSSLRV